MARIPNQPRIDEPRFQGILRPCECEKKAASAIPAASRSGDPDDSLETFHQRLRDLCEDHFRGPGRHRPSLAQDQAQCAVAQARELKILNTAEVTWLEFKSREEGVHFGTEHVVELSAFEDRVFKVTIPPAFGLIPRVVSHPVINLREDASPPVFRKAIEFLPATPLEYLERWIAANEVFEDDVRLTSVVVWADGQVSFGISQPQYHGEPAPHRDIDRFFEASGWTRITDPGGSGHGLFFNYAFGVLAIDALSRNCYLHENALLPFDVILCKPDEELEAFLGLYPG